MITPPEARPSITSQAPVARISDWSNWRKVFENVRIIDSRSLAVSLTSAWLALSRCHPA